VTNQYLAPAAVALDTGPLGLATRKRGQSAEADALQDWLDELDEFGIPVYVPEIVDYELRRELLRADKTTSIRRLDALNTRAVYLPLNTTAIQLAARLWSEARRAGQTTAGSQRLDGDVILAAQVQTLGVTGIVVATSNVAHLGRFVAAEDWHNIAP